MTNLEKTIKALTFAQAVAWFDSADRWEYVTANILAPNDLTVTDQAIMQVEDRLFFLIFHPRG